MDGSRDEQQPIGGGSGGVGLGVSPFEGRALGDGVSDAASGWESGSIFDFGLGGCEGEGGECGIGRISIESAGILEESANGSGVSVGDGISDHRSTDQGGGEVADYSFGSGSGIDGAGDGVGLLGGRVSGSQWA